VKTDVVLFKLNIAIFLLIKNKFVYRVCFFLLYSLVVCALLVSETHYVKMESLLQVVRCLCIGLPNDTYCYSDKNMLFRAT